MSTDTPAYDHYGDMLETHNEIGYLLVILTALVAFVFFLCALLWWWPQEDVYLVPGTTVFGEAGEVWNIPPPPPSTVAIPIRTPMDLTDPGEAPHQEAAPGDGPGAPAAPASPLPSSPGASP